MMEIIINRKFKCNSCNLEWEKEDNNIVTQCPECKSHLINIVGYDERQKNKENIIDKFIQTQTKEQEQEQEQEQTKETNKCSGQQQPTQEKKESFWDKLKKKNEELSFKLKEDIKI